MALLLFLHIAGAVLLVGNIVTAAFWHWLAQRTRSAEIVHFSAKTVMKADLAFTLPGILLIVGSGAAMAERSGYGGAFDWLTLSLVLFGLTGAIWLAVLLPLQRSMIRRSAEALDTGVIPRAYTRALLNWYVFGTAAVLLPVAVLYLMVAKPF